MRFAGYAARFDLADKGGDVIRRGAFAGSLAKGLGVPLLWQHRPDMVIGRITHLKEDARGLQVIAALDGEGDAARAARMLESGKVDGLSFGYRVKDAVHGARGRELIDLDLVEVSLVAQPMQPKARVHCMER